MTQQTSVKNRIGQAIREKTGKLHMIGNAHIDPVWLWRWQEGYHEVLATFRSALDRMKEYDDFIFVSSSAAYYEWVEQSDPGMFAEIQQRVAEGRWGIAGGWWIEPDCNIPSGESFVRQGLSAQHYFKEKFGIIARTGYNVDSFGHHGMLPQILKQSGLDYYVFMRPSAHEKGLPNRLFWWESDDGTRVLAYRLPYEYCSWPKDIEKHVRRCADEIREPFNEQMCFYGVGNHGGGPTRENLESIRRLNTAADLPELACSTPDAFFDRVVSQMASIPVVHSDLQHHASGCYAAHSGVKRWNRQAENLLLTAEKFSTLASIITGQKYPKKLGQAWKDVLFNQFHDILAGTCVESAYEDARNLYGEAMAIADRELNRAVQSLAWNVRIETEEGTRPFLVFNPHAWPARANIEMEIASQQGDEAMLDEVGEAIPMQKVQSLATANGRERISILADLPAMGYRMYRLVEGNAREALPMMAIKDTILENESLRLEIDPETGCIRSLRDKRMDVEVFLGPAARPVVSSDPSDTWGHNVFHFDREIDAFKTRSIRLMEGGEVKAVIRVAGEYGRSSLVQDFALVRGIDQVFVHVQVDWREQQKALKIRFPLNLNFMKATYEIPYGSIERFANGEEEPGQSWLDVSGVSRDSGNPYGLSLLNDGKYSFDVNVRDIGLTVLRSPIYAHHMPVVPQPDQFYRFIDQGYQEFHYALYPHSGSWEKAETVRRAAELNQKPVVLAASFHPEGKLPPAASFVRAEPANIAITALKQAEEGDDLILRAHETAKQATRASIWVDALGRRIDTAFRPNEIKTFRIPRDGQAPVGEVNLLEWSE